LANAVRQNNKNPLLIERSRNAPEERMIDPAQISAYLQSASPAPLHARLRDALAIQISNGTLKPGDALPSERILQEELGVSRATVRQALHGLIEAGLVQSVPGSGNYILGRQRTTVAAPPPRENNVVGLIVSYPSFHIYYGQLAAAFNQRLRQGGWITDMALHNDRVDSLKEILDVMLQHNVRVFAINPPPTPDMISILDDLRARGALVQLLGRWVNYPACDFVGANNTQTGYQATRYLLELGHTKIIYMGGAYYATGYERAGGYIRAMQEAGLPPRIFNVHVQRDRELAPDYLPYLAADNSPAALWGEMVQRKVTAAFCFNDDGAAWIYNEIRKFNLSVPQDISLVSVDNLPSYGYLDAPLTTFALPGEEVGRRAADLLLRRLTGENFPPQKIEIPPRFVQRLSAAPPRKLS
jgi:GntR family transcriptional regulator of arabinose operon